MTTRLRIWVAAMVAVGSLSCGGRVRVAEVRRPTSDLPIKKVVLYQNGVGYFEREGEVDGNVLTLHCRPHQINDLLKSLTVIDRGTGRPVSVSLPLERTGAKVLSELPKQVRDASGLLDVLRVFRGARVGVDGSEGKVSGRVVGVEEGLLAVTEKGPVTGWRLTVKTEEGQLVVYPVKSIKTLALIDRALEVGLDRSLSVSLDEGSWKPVSLTVRLAGDDDHQLLVSYIVEMPNWKPAYRLVVPKEGRPLLQGWAVVDNVSGESWHDVKLSLVAGTPMSFIYDLHSPRFTRRLDLTPRGVRTALAPTREEAGYSEDRAKLSKTDRPPKDRLQRAYSRKRRARSSMPRPSLKPPGGIGSGAMAPEPAAAPPVQMDADQALGELLEKQSEAKVQGEQVAGLFRYNLQDPVTVPDNSSTMVNIVNSRVQGQEVVLFRPELTRSHADSHPYRAVQFSNDTGFALEKGPVAIYARGTFVGEGFLERMERSASIFLTFAIDGNVSAKRHHESGQEAVRLLRISGGKILSEVLHIDRRRFTVTNRHDKPITAFFKSIAPSSSYRLRAAPGGLIKTPAATYVPVAVPAKGDAQLKIEWISPVKRWLAIDTSMARTVLKLFASQGNVPESIRPLVDKVVRAQDRIRVIDEEIRRIKQQKRELSEDQKRVRSNLDLLRKVKGNASLRAKLTRELAKLEGRLNKLTSRYVMLDDERARLKAQTRLWINQVSLTATDA